MPSSQKRRVPALRRRTLLALGASIASAGCFTSPDGPTDSQRNPTQQRTVSRVTARDETKNARNGRSLRIQNKHEQPHTVSVVLRQSGAIRFEDSYEVQAGETIEVTNVLYERSEFSLFATTTDGQQARGPVTVDADHVEMNVVIFENGDLDVWQSVCDACR